MSCCSHFETKCITYLGTIEGPLIAGYVVSRLPPQFQARLESQWLRPRALVPGKRRIQPAYDPGIIYEGLLVEQQFDASAQPPKQPSSQRHQHPPATR